MATIANIILFLTLSSTIHARESQFFAKVSNNNPKETQPLNTNQDFIPQSQQYDSSFGHESGQLPPTTTTTPTTTNNNNNNNGNKLPENYNPVAYTTPIHSTTQDIPEEYREYPKYRYNSESTMYNSHDQNDDNMYNSGFVDARFMETEDGGNMYNSEKQEVVTNGGNNNMYNSEKQGISDTRFLENGKYYHGYNSQKQGFEDARFMETQDGGNMYNSQKQGGYNQGETRYGTSGNANMYNTGKQGMSDTRFLENGKYFYDLSMENANTNTNMNSRNEYNTQGYYGNNENSYDRYNTNGGYQNQEEFQDEQFNP